MFSVRRKDDLTGALTLDLEFVLAGHFLMSGAGCGVLGGFCESPFHLLPTENVIDVHCEAPRLGARAR